jgi:hypothetical protein
VRQALRGGGLALITERRSIDLPAGPAVIRFRGVADTLVPQTVQVQGLAGAVKESDFDYALLSPGALIAKSLGKVVHLVRTNPKTGAQTDVSGRLVSGPDGVVVDEGAGAVEALRCSGLPERLVFDRVPDGLADKPTLSLRTVSPKAGRYVVTLSYLATGFNWSADYVARLRPDGKTLDLSGWLTLTNASAAAFERAPIQVVAGQVARTGDDQPVEPVSEPVSRECWAHEPWWSLMPEGGKELQEVIVTGVRRHTPPPIQPVPPSPPAPALALPPVPMATQTELGDYKLYTLPEPTTMAANQTKQVRFLDQAGAAYRRVYAYRVPTPSPYGVLHIAPQVAGTLITLKLVNEDRQGLGKPLPSGHVVVMTSAGAQDMFAGGDRIDDTPIGSNLTLTLGRSSLVLVDPEVDESSTVMTPQGLRPRLGVGVTATNAGPEVAVVEIRQAGGPSIQVQTEDQPHTLQAGDPCWTLTVPSGGKVVLHYSLVLTH